MRRIWPSGSGATTRNSSRECGPGPGARREPRPGAQQPVAVAGTIGGGGKSASQAASGARAVVRSAASAWPGRTEPARTAILTRKGHQGRGTTRRAAGVSGQDTLPRMRLSQPGSRGRKHRPAGSRVDRATRPRRLRPESPESRASDIEHRNDTNERSESAAPRKGTIIHQHRQAAAGAEALGKKFEIRPGARGGRQSERLGTNCRSRHAAGGEPARKTNDNTTTGPTDDSVSVGPVAAKTGRKIFRASNFDENSVRQKCTTTFLIGVNETLAGVHRFLPRYGIPFLAPARPPW